MRSLGSDWATRKNLPSSCVTAELAFVLAGSVATRQRQNPTSVKTQNPRLFRTRRLESFEIHTMAELLVTNPTFCDSCSKIDWVELFKESRYRAVHSDERGRPLGTKIETNPRSLDPMRPLPQCRICELFPGYLYVFRPRQWYPVDDSLVLCASFHELSDVQVNNSDGLRHLAEQGRLLTLAEFGSYYSDRDFNHLQSFIMGDLEAEVYGTADSVPGFRVIECSTGRILPY